MPNQDNTDFDPDNAADPAKEIIEDAFNKLDGSDIGAMHEAEVLEALSVIYSDPDKAKWQRIYHRLKKHRIAVDVEKAVKAFYKKNKFKKSSDNNASNNGFKDDKTRAKPDIHYNALVEINDEGNPALMIESKAVKIVSSSLNGFLSHDITSHTWHEFTGEYWKPLESQNLADKTIIGLLDYGAGEIGYKINYKNSIKSLLADGAMLPLPKTDHSKLPFRNGLLDLKTRTLEAITPNNAQTWSLPYAYQAGSDCPKIKEWLLQTVDQDKETVNFLRAWMAAVLHGRNDLQKFLHLKGSGGTGKGVFMRLLTALVGKSNTVSTSLNQLEQNRFESANLYNKRLAVISESDKYNGSINNLKAITGQDEIRLERKYQQQSGSFVFQGLVIMASNESLQVTDHTSGLDRRRITVIFDRRATNEEKQAWQQQGGEEVVLHGELPGLVNWLIELSQDDIAKIISNPPKRICDANLDAMTASNPIADWVKNCCVPDIWAWTQIGDKRQINVIGYETEFKNADTWLYANYLQWSTRANKSPVAIRRFRELLIQTCMTLNISVYESKHTTGMGINGLRIKQDDNQRQGWHEG